MGEISKSIM